jgi:hypothetical protein
LLIADYFFYATMLISNHQSEIFNQQSPEPTTGIEPVTYHLQGGCSAD